MHLRKRLLLALGICAISFVSKCEVAEAKELNLFNVVCDGSSFIYSSPDAKSDRLGDTVKGRVYNVYKLVNNDDNTVGFYCIRQGKKYVYVQYIWNEHRNNSKI